MLVFIEIANFSDGQEWLDARSKINPIMMQPRVVKTYTKPLDSVTQDFIERIKALAKASPISEMPENFDSEINKWALENVCYMGLDIRLGNTFYISITKMYEYKIHLITSRNKKYRKIPIR